MGRGGRGWKKQAQWETEEEKKWRMWPGSWASSPRRTSWSSSSQELRYDQMTPADSSQQGPWIAPEEDTAHLSRIQKALTVAKRADTKVRKIAHEKELRRKQWEMYTAEAKLRFINQRKNFENDMARLEREQEAAVEQGRMASGQVKAIVAGTAPDEDMEEPNSARAWEALWQSVEHTTPSSDFLAEAMIAAGYKRTGSPSLGRGPTKVLQAGMETARFQVGELLQAKPDQGTFLKLLSVSLQQAESLAAARRWFDQATGAGLYPTSFTIATLVEAAATGGDLEDAAEWYEELLRSSTQPVLNLLLDAAAQVDLALAKRWYERALALGLKADVQAFNTLITAAARKGDLESAESWYSQGKGAGLDPNEKTFRMLIETCIGRRDLAAATYWFRGGQDGRENGPEDGAGQVPDQNKSLQTWGWTSPC
ncbi:Pentatricopeptide repeat-containing protein, chloroplastic [Symbiodinium microadriaticum]|uniref:Pentatricopeptide repeat-containing protein, chloroplastic n=1 Tax=Symbiodinium microadriaticum TaxID=2951 RepID=A0A1Q9CVT9_SYMMI|nr:Pentatricopeptide repeat-containing protein, chloroplastic [Symbiodinium microadriaticum]